MRVCVHVRKVRAHFRPEAGLAARLVEPIEPKARHGVGGFEDGVDHEPIKGRAGFAVPQKGAGDVNICGHGKAAGASRRVEAKVFAAGIRVEVVGR